MKTKLKEPFTKVQRYVLSQDLAVKTLVLRYKPGKEVKMYTIRPFGGSSSRGKQVSSSPFIASLDQLQSVSIKRETRIKDDLKSMLKTVISLLKTFSLSSNEALADVCVTCIRGYDGFPYLLNCSRVRVHDIAFSMRTSSMRAVSLPRLSISRSPAKGEISDKNPLKYANYSQTGSLQLLQRPGCEGPLRARPSARMSETASDNLHIYEVGNRTDNWSLEHDLGTKSEFHTKIVRKMFEKACSNAALARYFPRNSLTVAHIQRTVITALHADRTVQGVKEAHRRLGITAEDFDSYVGMMEEAMRSQGTAQERVERAVERVNRFKREVVGC